MYLALRLSRGIARGKGSGTFIRDAWNLLIMKSDTTQLRTTLYLRYLLIRDMVFAFSEDDRRIK